MQLESVGSAYFDCVQFEHAPTASRYNLIEDGDFQYASTDGTPAYGWLRVMLDAILRSIT